MPRRVGRRFMRWLREDYPAVIVLALYLAALAVVFNSGRSTISRLETVRVGVCELRANLKAQIAASQRFRDDILSGRRKPIPGISLADIQQGIDRQQKTVDALAGISCPEPKGAMP